MKKHSHLDLRVSKPCEQCGKDFFRDTRCTWKYWNKQRFCSRECFGVFWHETSESTFGSMEERFWANVEKAGPDDCWAWLGHLGAGGYGVISIKGKRQRAHRISLELAGHVIPNGKFALHTCDNKSCVNPKHLYVGTHADNMRDASVRQRHPHRKLEPDDVRYIRSSHESAKSLAEKFSVSAGLIYQIRSGRKWRHV